MFLLSDSPFLLAFGATSETWTNVDAAPFP